MDAPAGLHRHLHRLCRLLPRAQELLDGHSGTGPLGLRQERTEHRPVDECRGLRPFEIPHGKRLGPQQRPGFPALGTGAGRAVDDVHDRPGTAARPRTQGAGHRPHGGPELPGGMVQRHGLAPVRAGHDALVLAERTRHEDVDLELRPQRRRGSCGSHGRLRRPVVRIVVLRLPFRILLPHRNVPLPGRRVDLHRAGGLRADPRHPAVVQPALRGEVAQRLPEKLQRQQEEVLTSGRSSSSTY